MNQTLEYAIIIFEVLCSSRTVMTKYSPHIGPKVRQTTDKIKQILSLLLFGPFLKAISKVSFKLLKSKNSVKNPVKPVFLTYKHKR